MRLEPSKILDAEIRHVIRIVQEYTVLEEVVTDLGSLLDKFLPEAASLFNPEHAGGQGARQGVAVSRLATLHQLLPTLGGGQLLRRGVPRESNSPLCGQI